MSSNESQPVFVILWWTARSLKASPSVLTCIYMYTSAKHINIKVKVWFIAKLLKLSVGWLYFATDTFLSSLWFIFSPSLLLIFCISLCVYFLSIFLMVFHLIYFSVVHFLPVFLSVGYSIILHYFMSCVFLLSWMNSRRRRKPILEVYSPVRAMSQLVGELTNRAEFTVI